MNAQKKGCLIGLAVIGLCILGIILLVAVYLGVRYFQFNQQEAMAPAIEIISPTPNATGRVQEGMTIQAAAVANGNPVASLRFFADGFLAGEIQGPQENLVGTWNWAPQSEGTHSLSFMAYNQEGKSNLVTMSIEVLPTADRDEDGVPDEKDSCPDQSGPIASQGCPVPDDRDGDGVVDAEDKCPDLAGDLEAGGCPPALPADRDLDGVPDELDRCPDQPGLPEWDGCPAGAWVADRDGDGLPDFLDTCPDSSGTLESDGCPIVTTTDTDGDGILDDLDDCDEEAGPSESGGCPIAEDRDGDGIADDSDVCPDEAGLEEYDGCLPEGWDTDADGDGVMDFIDEWDSEPGPAETLGCPLPDDRDGDGVPDSEDSCPDLAGEVENSGCPYILIPMPRPDLELILPPIDICSITPTFCDRDRDGILNEEDACPDEYGLALFYGCPLYAFDMDGDGVLDDDDICPTEAGDPVNNGCPDPSDSDRDGVPPTLDYCPDEAGPAPNHGCPRLGGSNNVQFKVLQLNTNAGWSGVFCYLTIQDYGRFRIPEAGYLPRIDEDTWNLGDRNKLTLEVTDYGWVYFNVHCWASLGDPGILPQPIGEAVRGHGYADWDNQIRRARAEGPGGWIEVVYQICRGSCP